MNILQDKVMMNRWGLDGMQSFQQPDVARKEGDRLKECANTPQFATDGINTT